MIFSYDDLLSIQEVIADVLLLVDDEEQRLLPPGYYRTQVKYALDELSFDTFFVDVTEDYSIPDNLKVKVPKGSFNLKQIWAYSGTPDEVKYLENVNWKRNFDTRGYDTANDRNTGYGARSHEGNITDPFVKAPYGYVTALFFNVREGMILLSDTCSSYDYIRIQYAGVASSKLDIDEIKMVPPMARKAVVLWVTDKAAASLKSRSEQFRIKYRQVQADVSGQLDEYGYDGAWHQAKMRLKELDRKMLRDMLEYNSKLVS